MPMLTAPVTWIGSVPTHCQLSGRKLTKQFVDGNTGAGWAIMHPQYFRSIGGRYGTGRGQLYEKTADGRWQKIEG